MIFCQRFVEPLSELHGHAFERSKETRTLEPTLEILTPPGDGPCVLRATLPPGAAVPLHSHPDAETFYALSGALEGYAGSWRTIGPGDVFHVPAGDPHAFRNTGSVPAVAIVATTARLGDFFRELEAAPERLTELAARYGHDLQEATP